MCVRTTNKTGAALSLALYSRQLFILVNKYSWEVACVYMCTVDGAKNGSAALLPSILEADHVVSFRF